ncbi:MAG: hypothetical protein ACI8S6_000531 [Myxococcota bacterium]|jgi:hypothetical protein
MTTQATTSAHAIEQPPREDAEAQVLSFPRPTEAVFAQWLDHQAPPPSLLQRLFSMLRFLFR